MLFTPLFLGILLFSGRSLRFLCRPSRLGAAAAEKLIEQREGSGSSFRRILIIFGLVLSEHAAHFVAEHIQVILRDAHLLDNLIDLGNAQGSGTLQAVSFIQGVSVFNSGNKHHCHIFLTFYAHFWLHD